MNGKETKFSYNEYIKPIGGHTILQIVGFINDDYVVDIYDDDMKHSFRENKSMYHIDNSYEYYNI